MKLSKNLMVWINQGVKNPIKAVKLIDDELKNDPDYRNLISNLSKWNSFNIMDNVTIIDLIKGDDPNQEIFIKYHGIEGYMTFRYSMAYTVLGALKYSIMNKDKKATLMILNS